MRFSARLHGPYQVAPNRIRRPLFRSEQALAHEAIILDECLQGLSQIDIPRG